MLTLSRRNWSLPDTIPSSASTPQPPISCAAAHQQSVVNVGTLSRTLQRGERLPEAYRWKVDDDQELCVENEAEQLPVIDLSPLLPLLEHEDPSSAPLSAAAQRVCAQIMEACEEWGAFQVINHGVGERVIEQARSRGLELFSLPDEDKLRAERAAGTLFGYGATRMASFFNRLMWSEAFTMMGSPNSNIGEYERKLWNNNSNNNNINNKEDERFGTSFQSFDHAMRKLALLVIRLIFHGLGASPRQIEETGNFWGMIHMNHYPPCPTPTEAMGLASHTDSSCLTIMDQGKVAGLQVKRRGKWIAVKPVSRAFVVQVGDMLQVMSNNVFRSVVHRAVVNDRYTRMSLVYFFTPPPLAAVAPVHPGQSLYRCLTWNEYLQAKGRLFMGALDHFLLP